MDMLRCQAEYPSFRCQGSLYCHTTGHQALSHFVAAASAIPASAFSIFEITSSQLEILCRFSKNPGLLYDIQILMFSFYDDQRHPWCKIEHEYKYLINANERI